MSVYLYTLDEDYTFDCRVDLPDREYKDNGKTWLTVQGRTCTIHKGYSWDGCSPKFKLGGLIFGTWDGPLIYHGYSGRCEPSLKYASLEHDVLLQFRPVGLHIDTIHDIFDKHMKKVDFKYRNMYHNAVILWSRFKGIYR